MKGYTFNPDGTKPSFTSLVEMQIENLLVAAFEYHRRRFIVTPLLGKRPMLGRWQKRILKEIELPRYFRDERNIGIVLGAPAGVVDVDLDNPVAVAVAGLLLPSTMKSGREKSLCSHHWYICDPVPAPRKYPLPKFMAARLMVEPGEKMLVELRSTGQLTMVAPSIHPVEGDLYLWHPGEICEIDGEVLADLVQDVALAALLALNRPLGSREWFAIHAAGYLSPRVGYERTAAILRAASSAFDDEEHDERMKAVRSSLREPFGEDPTMDAAMAAEVERLAPGLPDVLSRWCERGRREGGDAR